MKEGRDIPTFREKLVPHGEHAEKTREDKLFQLEGRDDLVIRPVGWERLVRAGEFQPNFPKNEIRAEEFARLSKQYVDELGGYGIDTPVSFVVARDQAGLKEVFAVVDNVRKSPNADKRTMGVAFAALRKALLKYYADKFDHSEAFLRDLVNDRQYIYGRKVGDTQDHIYLVDVEPRIQKNPAMLSLIIYNLDEAIDHERKFFGIPEYEQVQKEADALLDRVEPSV